MAMSLTSDLLRIVDEAQSLPRILDEAVRAIAQQLRVEACFAFLTDERGRLTRAVAFGGPGQAVEAEAELVAARALAERQAFVLHGEGSSILACPMILRESPLGVVVLQDSAGRDYSVDDIA